MILPGASSLIEAIGLVAGSIDVVRFGLNNFAPVAPGGTGNTSVRIGLGLETNNVLGIQTYTALPDIRLFNESGGFVGMAENSGHFSKNGRGDIKINIGKHKDRGKRPTYTIFSANEHALCIAYASITWPGGDMYAFDGGWGRACGGPWYYSNYYVSTEKVNPTCMWVDGVSAHILRNLRCCIQFDAVVTNEWWHRTTATFEKLGSRFTGLISCPIRLPFLMIKPRK